MPRAYAASSRSGRRSPPAASNPGGSDSAISSGGKRSGGSSAASQVIMVRASGCRRLARCGQMLERRVCLGFARVGVDGGALANQVGTDRAAHRRISNPVRRPRDGRGEAARELVLTLRARLKAREALLDAVVDPLVVAGLEVQAVVIVLRAPVASVERILRAQEYGSGDRATPVAGQLDDEALAKATCDGGEAGAIQIGCVAMTQEGHGVKGMYALERSLVELVSVQRHEFDTLLGDAPALAARFLALLGGEALQEVIEIAVRLVVPLKVTIAPQEPAGRLGGLAGRLVEKQAMYRGHTPLIGLAAHPLEQRRAQRSRRQIRPGQQPRAGGRREGHRADELWIVGQAALLGGARPGEVEHELAPGMLLAIQRRGS